MKENLLRLTLFIVLLFIGIGLIELKKEVIRNKRSQKVESPLSLFIEKGAPVHVLEVRPLTLRTYKVAILESCGNSLLCTFMSRYEKRDLDKGQTVLDGENNELLGKIRSVGRTSNISNGLFKVVIDPQADFISRKKISARILTGEYKDVLAVPRSALDQSGDEYFLWKLSEDESQATKVSVMTGRQGVKNVEIVSGITAGSEIVLRGANQFQKYQKLRVIKKVNSADTQPNT